MLILYNSLNVNHKTSNFGEHLTLDGYGGDRDLLNDEMLVRNALSDLPSKLGMKTLSEPQVYFAPDNRIKDPGGWSGFVVIMESHISIHTFPKRGFVSADVYTCQNGLDINFISEYFTNLFKLKNIETNFIKRGTKYPTENAL